MGAVHRATQKISGAEGGGGHQARPRPFSRTPVFRPPLFPRCLVSDDLAHAAPATESVCPPERDRTPTAPRRAPSRPLIGGVLPRAAGVSFSLPASNTRKMGCSNSTLHPMYSVTDPIPAPRDRDGARFPTWRGRHTRRALPRPATSRRAPRDVVCRRARRMSRCSCRPLAPGNRGEDTLPETRLGITRWRPIPLPRCVRSGRGVRRTEGMRVDRLPAWTEGGSSGPQRASS